MNMDIAHKRTERQLQHLETELTQFYNTAQKDLTAKLNKHLADFERKDKDKHALLSAGKITEEDYKNWLQGQVFQTKRMQTLINEYAKNVTRVNIQAQNITRGYLSPIFADNSNFVAYSIETQLKQDIGFTLYDKTTINNMLQGNPRLLPKRRIDTTKYVKWNVKAMNRQVAQGIIQGEDIRTIAKRLRSVTDMNKEQALRNARTAVTQAQNSGRMQRMAEAEELGVKLKKIWLSAIDNRTRHTHRILDHQKQDYNEPFIVEGMEIMYPGDYNANASLVYQCRCTLKTDALGITGNVAKKKLESDKYKEWKSK